MKNILITSLLILLFLSSLVGQEKSFTEFDLYGQWVLELNENGRYPEKPVFVYQKKSDTILSEKWVDISLQAFGTCEFNSNRLRFVCAFPMATPDTHT